MDGISTDKCRDAFEQHHPTMSFNRTPSGRYHDDETMRAFSAWEIAWKAARVGMEEYLAAVNGAQWHMNKIIISNYTTAKGRDDGIYHRNEANRKLNKALTKLEG